MKSQAELFLDGACGRSRIEDNEWEYFVDPKEQPEFFEHMTEPIQVQFLGESWEKGPWIVPNKFAPNCKADEHAHNYTTIYYILKGSLNFNDGSGWYNQGDLRWIHPDHEYGPEEAGPEGCEFLLVSYGPMDVQWKGAETANVGKIEGK